LKAADPPESALCFSGIFLVDKCVTQSLQTARIFERGLEGMKRVIVNVAQGIY
jgi:hypothetical protein